MKSFIINKDQVEYKCPKCDKIIKGDTSGHVKCHTCMLGWDTENGVIVTPRYKRGIL